MNEKSEPEPFLVPPDKKSWDVEFFKYEPTYYVSQKVLDNDMTKNPGGWADPEDITKVKRPFHSYTGKVIKLDEHGRPINPIERTGRIGRWNLGKWGPNFAADPIVTRINKGVLECLLIQRRDTKEWAIPGGMVDEGETASQTLKREFKEETGVELYIKDAVEIYRGYVYDPRNTDNAWMETTAMHKYLTLELAEKMNPVAGDDAQAVRWMALTEEVICNLYASHGEILKKAMREFYKREGEKLSGKVKEQIERVLKL